MTAVIAVIALFFVVAMILINPSSSGNTGTTGSTGSTGVFCSGPGTRQSAPPPNYHRKTSKSTCKDPLSTSIPSFPAIDHTVQKLYRTRSLKGPISPNYWSGNAMYGDTNNFCVYPYLASIQDNGFTFSWPNNGTLFENCGVSTCTTGNADLSYNVGSLAPITVSDNGNESLYCDIVDYDALITTVIWQYSNPITSKIGSLTTYLTKGSPYITIEAIQSSISLECGFNIILTPYQGQISYLLEIDNTSGYVLFLPHIITLSLIDNVVSIPKITGTIRIAYYDSSTMLNTLTQHYAEYPTETTVSSTATTGTNEWITNTTYTFTTKNMYKNGTDTNMLMMSLPHHNITNITMKGMTGYHSLIGPYQFITTEDNNWDLNYNVPIYDFTYPSVSGTGTLLPVWTTEFNELLESSPTSAVDWCKWLGSIAILLLIGDMLGADISSGLTLLETQLSLLNDNDGTISTYIKFVRDKTWGGIISNLGITNCQGTSDDGNAFYQNHIGQYGYLIFAFAVVGYFDPSFLNTNEQIALYFTRNVVNPYEFDKIFPLWRHKDWYLGYSLSTGLVNENGIKEMGESGEVIMGYFASYLLGMLLNNTELIQWSLGMLAMELTSLQYYYQYTSYDAVDVNSAFVQGTITNRSDASYMYTSINGNSYYPERNASNMISILKPLTLLSNSYVNTDWAITTQPWMNTAITPLIQPESLAYAESLVVVNSTNKDTAINNIVKGSKTGLLPYGSTWSSVLYWILAI